MTVLSNVKPFEGPGRPNTVGEWLGTGGTLLKPELFHHRWRTDKDPTSDLASYSFVVKRPVSSSANVGDNAQQIILESDLISQFSQHMTDLTSLDDITKQRALRQLLPIMGQFKSVVSRFTRDSMLMKTCQGRRGGRSEASVIAQKANGVKKRFAVSNRSPLGQSKTILPAKNHEAESRAKDRKPRGNNNHIPDAEKWECTLCKTKVKNNSQLIAQHKQGKRHNTLLNQMRHCDRCDVYFPNTPDAVNSHNASFAHTHQQRLEAEGGSRDGDTLAKNTRDRNGGSVAPATKQQKKSKP
jgi:hypothetical protein